MVGKTLSFDEILKKHAKDDGEEKKGNGRLSVDSVLNKDLTITAVTSDSTQDGDDLVVFTTDLGEVASGGKVLLKQGKWIKEALDSGTSAVSARIVSKKSPNNPKWHYYTMEGL